METTIVYWADIWDNGKENGNCRDYRGSYRGSIGVILR